MKDNRQSNHGFSLVEILIALAMASIILITIIQAFSSQEQANITQQALVELQQSLRDAMYLMTTEIRLAGYDQSGVGTAGAGIVQARPGLIQFTKDDNENGGRGNGDTFSADENIMYGFDDATDANHTGNMGNGVGTLGRQTCPGSPPNCAGYQALAENIQVLRFEYAFDNDGDGVLDTNGGNVIWAIDPNNSGSLNSGGGISFGNIRAVRIWILARTKVPFRNDIPDTNTYQLGDAGSTSSLSVGPFNDTYRRRVVMSVIECRNMGLQ